MVTVVKECFKNPFQVMNKDLYCRMNIIGAINLFVKTTVNTGFVTMQFLYNPGRISLEVQNKGNSDLINRHMSIKNHKEVLLSNHSACQIKRLRFLF